MYQMIMFSLSLENTIGKLGINAYVKVNIALKDHPSL